jgi:hypothetical protein
MIVIWNDCDLDPLACGLSCRIHTGLVYPVEVALVVEHVAELRFTSYEEGQFQEEQ